MYEEIEHHFYLHCGAHLHQFAEELIQTFFLLRHAHWGF